MGNVLNDSWTNSARQLFISDEAGTPSWTFVPTTDFDETANDSEDTWFSSADVDANGTPWENGVVTATSTSYACGATFEKDGAATPALKAGLKAIRDMKGTIGSSRKKYCLVVEPDGEATVGWYDFTGITTLKGQQNNVARLAWTMKSRGAVEAFTDELPSAA